MNGDTKLGIKNSEATDVIKLSTFIQNKIKVEKERTNSNDDLHVAIFTHATPDPDAIGSQMGMKFYLEQMFGLEVDCFYDGEISHPQNKIFVQLLDPHLQRASDYDPDKYFLNVVVDTLPKNAGVAGKKVPFHLVVDHHKDLPEDFDGFCLHYHTGSACGIVYDVIKQSELEFNTDNEEHVKIASALLVGVITDTDHCMKSDTTTKDFDAQQGLFRFRDADSVRKIVRFNWPMSWIKLRGIAINECVVEDSIAVVGLGILSTEQKDVISVIADDMLTWGNVQTAIVFALFDGQRIQGSVRTNVDTVEVHTMCQMLAGRYGSGGGKYCSGGYCKPLGSMEFDHDEDDVIIDNMWQLIKTRETTKIFKLFKK